MTTGQKPLCLTQGDPSGIGPDIALALYASIRAGAVQARIPTIPGLSSFWPIPNF